MSRIIFVDLETTGLSSMNHEIWECAAVSVDPLNQHDMLAHHWFVECHLVAADPEALEIGKYHSRHPNGDDYHDEPMRPTTKRDFIGEFAEISQGCTLAANNACFDVSFLKAAWSEMNYTLREPWHYSPIDVKSYALGAMIWGGTVPVPKTSEIGEKLGVIANDAAHTAMSDAWFAMRVYFAARVYSHV